MTVALWSSDAWLTAVVGWIDRRLAERGLERRGDVTQPHLRPWATVLRVVTGDGTLWFKAGSTGTAFEAALYETLARVTPERILLPLAVDAARGWILLPDGGPSLAEAASGEERLSGLARALERYGELQRELVPHVDELLAEGVADMRPEAMPARFEQALEATRPDGPREAVELWERIAARRETVAAWCAELAASPLPASLDHNDLHPWNVLGGPRFYDWGDSVVAHPFAVALVPLGFFDDPVPARDAYLRGFGDPDALAPALELACRVAKVARALSWERALRGSREQGEAIEPRFEHAALETLAGVLDPSYLLRR